MFHQLIDLAHVLRGGLVQILFRPAHLVLAGLAIFLDPVKLVVGLTPDIAQGHLGVLALALGLLDQLAAALLGELRNGDTNDAAIIARVQAQIRVADRVFDGLELVGLIGLDDHHARLGHVDTGHLRDRGRSAVVVDDDPLEHAGVCPPGPNGREVVAGDRHGLFHLLLGIEKNLVNHD
ncbi:Uncharacterised protein [Mycobacteroides abscessus subsp. abscessus]|nr:Uncharacterised protein [Mycobacteroides abscessus subsp. abscessus]